MTTLRDHSPQLRYLDERSAKEILRRCGIRVPRGLPVTTPVEAARAWSLIGPAVALKVIQADVPHKREVEAMAGPLTTGDEVTAAAAALLARHPRNCGLLVEEWLRAQYEVSLSLRLRTGVGPVLISGDDDPATGGLRDVRYFRFPLDGERVGAAARWICRRHATVNSGQLESLECLLVTLNAFSSTWATSGYREIELHPVIISEEDRAVAVDVLIVFEEMLCAGNIDR